MGEPRPIRPGVTAAETGADWWDSALRALHAAPRGALDHADLYDLAAELVATLRALEALTRLLARDARADAERDDLRDDEDADPTARLEQAAHEVLVVGRLLGAALRPANAFWSAVGHIGLQFDPVPTTDEHAIDEDDDQQEGEQR